MAKNRRRERRAKDPGTPQVAQIGAIIPNWVLAFIDITGEVYLFLGDNRTGQSITPENAIANVPMKIGGFFYTINDGPVLQFDNVFKNSDNSIALIKNNAGWSELDVIRVWSPGWQSTVRGAVELYLAPFRITGRVEP